MTLLIVYILVALVFSFLCSVAEAVLLSVSSAYVALLEKKGSAAGPLLRRMRKDINKPLAAILTLNTIAHTIGAAGAGAQVAVVFGNAYLGVASAILTLLILIFSEIIPKTLGAHHWRTLAPATAYGLRVLVWILYPFVKMSELLTRGLTDTPKLSGFSRQEFAVMAELSAREGQLAERESEVLKNLLLLRDTGVKDAMTPRPVVFSLPGDTTVEAFFDAHGENRFSRIPLYSDDPDALNGFVLRADLLLARAQNKGEQLLSEFERPMPVLPESLSLAQAFRNVLRHRSHIAQIVDEYGVLEGILTLEDIIETLLGLEIVDEGDEAIDMQEHARRLWRRRARKMGIEPPKRG
ncbi:MAG: HlyC/CorC family transporter [Xanthomonadales bacterium]|nr:hemolysin family protein [Gammaproteobacteria bacterium]MBT8050479.1 hemolysin family protein [Gammaproteobacteria bacterium]MBT8057851.1 hemolysin family protein [Gammaproteobacteria bacterium]NNJ80315.1 HlyC/CorC family transporter [Xanthomonadales bacterium]NNL04352.1 HlyC/CorC family transporter [Xanthomonadales bacterium]